MGPHSFERGNTKLPPRMTTISPLQWGLTLSSEETWYGYLSPCGLAPLQWGLTLSSEETGRRIGLWLRRVPASMGPHSFERGNLTI